MPSTGGRDYVGSMYQAYKDHLRSAGVRKLPCRPAFHKYVWLLKEAGAIVFDGAQAISFDTEPPEDLPPNYEPARCNLFLIVTAPCIWLGLPVLKAGVLGFSQQWPQPRHQLRPQKVRVLSTETHAQ